MVSLFIISFCFLASCLITPYVIQLAHFTKAVDQPNDRKVHQKVMPRMGGLAIYIAFLLGYMVFKSRLDLSSYISVAFIDAYFISSFLMVLTGMLDDMFELPAKPKALSQLVAALIMVFYGNFVIETLELPFLPTIHLGWLGGIITLVWIVGITNAINLIDGLDGLSCGLSAISFGTIAFLAFVQGDFFVAVMCFLLLGSTLGFLVHNFHPAKIFMGDTGSLFLGFSVSVFALLGYKNATFVSFIIPIVVLSIPIFDTLWAIIRRTLNGQSLLAPDRGHVHHQLLDRNLGHRQSVLILYAIAILFSLTAIVYTLISKSYGLGLLIVDILIIEFIFNTTGLFRRKNTLESTKEKE